MRVDPLNFLRTRPSIPRGLRHAGFIRLKRSAWKRGNFLMRFLTILRLSAGDAMAACFLPNFSACGAQTVQRA
eukprot:CAMPEP_0175213254 /NCGR_PEP_ID=MMETSP0093-20121207/16095_1 /TAXON_ID=311494 /ORGANISM="Alexandrium monilatum, Strain CCMP3105" /LENGTH=72 /DNA_ID=CAMNT_0016506567 /DNA_START=70 /DNA_END=288 /DNA_ORIENTATION=-